jgi:sugar phosphate isomerase/epimerase
MEIAIHNWMRAESIETTLNRMSDLGYDKIEIQGSPELYDTNHVLKLLKSYHLTCWGAVTLMFGDRNLLAKDVSKRKKTIQYVKDVIQMVHRLEGEMVSVVPATVGKIVPEGKPEDEWLLAVEGLQEIYEYSENLGISIGIEPINRFETYFINRSDQALALAEEVGPNCGVCLDTFHMNIEEINIVDSIINSKDRLVGFHVADNNRLSPGMGHLPWTDILDALKSINYNSVLSVEFCPSLDRTPANPYPNSIDHQPKNLSSEQKKFLEDHGSSAVTESFYHMLSENSIHFLKKILS